VMFVPYLGDGVSPWMAHCPRAGVAFPSGRAAPERRFLAVARGVDPPRHRVGSRDRRCSKGRESAGLSGTVERPGPGAALAFVRNVPLDTLIFPKRNSSRSESSDRRPEERRLRDVRS
jgi:hypothetical protein